MKTLLMHSASGRGLHRLRPGNAPRRCQQERRCRNGVFARKDHPSLPACIQDGGAIEVTANDRKDSASRDQIQMHLGHIARMFADGNFRAPMLVHSRTPPGVPTLEKLKSEVTYRFEKIDRGGRVRITTANAEALQALHEFLRFQIADHKTGGFRQGGCAPRASGCRPATPALLAGEDLADGVDPAVLAFEVGPHHHLADQAGAEHHQAAEQQQAARPSSAGRAPCTIS